jgi:hypothetical protein
VSMAVLLSDSDGGDVIIGTALAGGVPFAASGGRPPLSCCTRS